jgi:uncharacterized membrane protein
MGIGAGEPRSPSRGRIHWGQPRGEGDPMRGLIILAALAIVAGLLATACVNEDGGTMGLLWAFLIGGGVAVALFWAWRFLNGLDRGDTRGHQGKMRYKSESDQLRAGRLRALSIARERYEKGEITAEQYEKVRRDLGDLPP